MGIITYFAKEIAKDIALNTTLGVAGTIGMKIESATEKKNARKKEKLFNERKKNKHLLICPSGVQRTLITNAVKQKSYTISDEEKVKCVVCRYLKEKRDVIEVKTVDSKDSFLKIYEVKSSNSQIEKQYEVIIDNQKYAYIAVSTLNSSCKMMISTGDTWNIDRKDEKEYEIEHMTKVVGHCRTNKLHITACGMLVDFIPSEETINILCMTLCFYIATDRMI